MRPVRSCGLAAFVILAAGCGQSVHHEKSVSIEPGQMLAPIVLDGPKKEQRVKVEVSADSPIDVWIIVGKDENAILKELENPKHKLDVRASASKSKSATLDATIPAGSDYGVYLANAVKKTEVKLTVRSQ